MAHSGPQAKSGPDDSSTPQPVDAIETIARALLVEIGEDPDREGLRGTPARYARWWREFANYDAGRTDTVFETAASGQFVAVTGIHVWSLCEHHLLPFSCVVDVAYLTRDRMLGVSKFARIAHECARRLQVQERLVCDIAEQVEKLVNSPDIAVVARGRHLCMAMRGIQADALVTSTVWRGAFDGNADLRSELFKIAATGGTPER